MFRIHAYNASGDTLFFTADADGADHIDGVTATEAYDIMATRKSGHRWNDDTHRFTRNRIARFRLVHASGHSEHITPAEAVAVVNAPKPTPAAEPQALDIPAVAPIVVTPITETTEESLALLAIVAAAVDTERPAVPVVLPGQWVRITGGRFAGVETTPSMIQPSGWLEFTTNSRRGFGIERKNVAPGNWEPVPYAVGLHDFNPTSGGAICVTPVLLPNGTVTACMEPVKGAIHDPQAYAAYYAELTGELKKWVSESQYVTVAQPGRRTAWHLTDRDGQPVAAGEHITDTGLHFTIDAEPDASCDRRTGEPVRIAVTYRGSGVAWIKAEMLVTGWSWTPESI